MFDYFTSGDKEWLNAATAEVKFCLRFRRCCHSNKLLWFRFAYKVYRSFRIGDNNFITVERWYDRHEFLILKLKLGF